MQITERTVTKQPYFIKQIKWEDTVVIMSLEGDAFEKNESKVSVGKKLSNFMNLSSGCEWNRCSLWF